MEKIIQLGSREAVNFKDEKGRDVVEFIRPNPEDRENKFRKICNDASVPSFWPEPNQFSTRQDKIYQILATGKVNAVITGGTGRGKTVLCIAALARHHAEGKQVGIVRMANLKYMFEPTRKDETGESEITLLSRYLYPAFLLIDDVGNGTEGPRNVSQHERQVLFDLVSMRQAQGLITWITSNQRPNYLEQAYHDTFMSRMRANDGLIVELGGEDFRSGTDQQSRAAGDQ